MRTLSAAASSSFTAVAHSCPDWLKSTARVACVLGIVKGSAWLIATWLAFRGFGAL